jgi:hypothetical protein
MLRRERPQCPRAIAQGRVASDDNVSADYRQLGIVGELPIGI